MKINTEKSLSQIASDKSIIFDDGQEYVGKFLDNLLKQLNIIQKKSFVSKFFTKRNNKDIKGLYLHGGVGRGKSMMMDLFFYQVKIKEKRRLHFHDFMKEVHQRILEKRKIEKNKDTVLSVGQDLARASKLLCFDEMEVKDIADAMILSRLFEVMFDEGMILVTTSNQPPDGLYKDGLHRDRILPFLENLKQKTNVVKIPEGEDWRQRSLHGKKYWISPVNAQNKLKLNEVFKTLSLGFEIISENVEVSGRQIHIPEVAAGVARIGFDDLCNKPLAASDYIEIALRYKGLIIDNIPSLNDNLRNETRRFIWLIDALYDKGCFLIAIASKDFKGIYTGEHWKFEFKRTISRITEMSQF